ncbi:MAG: hypothetical protein LBG63_03800 [Candidatus Methanoplasma sp.]|nr:hypothetical protein [Candidatus Methanoplasma sp.]
MENGDIAEWIERFLSCAEQTVLGSMKTAESVLEKGEFWRSDSAVAMNERRSRTVNILLDESQSILTSSRWARINSCSQDTAINDIKDLIAKGTLFKYPLPAAAAPGMS